MTERWYAAACAARRWMEERQDEGYDPFDAGLSPLARLLPPGRWVSVGWIQLHKRLPIQLRPACGIRPHLNPKTLALALQGELRLVGAADGESGIDHIAKSRILAGRLLALQKGGGWGYPFPWANRHFSLPAGTPASVPTAFSLHALLDLEAADPETRDDLVPALREGAAYLSEKLRRVPAAGGFLFSYTGVDERGVHNASLLSASTLARIGRRIGDERLLGLAAEAIEASLRAQRADGSWPYGLSRRDEWVDSFHTGYNLTALRHLVRDLARPDLQEALRRGFQYWQGAFLGGPGVTLSPGRRYPVDTHSLAQGILTLLEFAGEEEDVEAEASRLGGWALAHLRRPDGSFVLKRGILLTNPLPYMRWSQAWIFRALAELACIGRPARAPGGAPRPGT